MPLGDATDGASTEPVNGDTELITLASIDCARHSNSVAAEQTGLPPAVLGSVARRQTQQPARE
jgi:hypothetical protein